MHKDGEYWKERFRQMEEAQNRVSMEKAREMQKQFERAQAAINGKIHAWYQRFAKNNGVSMAEARRMLSAQELKELRWSVEDYIRHGKENAISNAWEKQLENASARVHIRRLEALNLEVKQEMEKLYGNLLDSVDGHIRDVYRSDFYHTAYEIQRRFGVGSSLRQLDGNMVGKIVAKPWAVDGKNFSDRIWESRTKLINQVHNSLSMMCITGESPDRAIREIAKCMNVSRQQAGRLVMTESAAFANKAREDCMKSLGVKEFEVVETLDAITCDYCQGMDGKHFSMDDFQIGVTAPPFHPNCRGCTCPYFDDEFTAGEQRAARGEDGKTYYVPSDMSYKDWKKSFVVDGTDMSQDELDAQNEAKAGIDGKRQISYEGIPKTWKKLSEKADVSAVNPTGNKQNCVNCTIAYEMRKRGYAVVADESIRTLKKNVFGGWMFPDIKRVSANEDSLSAIRNDMDKWGEGARAQIAVIWNKRKNTSGIWDYDSVLKGHSFIAEYKDGKVVFIDVQNGEEYTENIFKRFSDNPVEYCRIDNLMINDLGATACKKE